MMEGSCALVHVPEQARGLAYPLTRLGRKGRTAATRIFRLNMVAEDPKRLGREG